MSSKIIFLCISLKVIQFKENVSVKIVDMNQICVSCHVRWVFFEKMDKVQFEFHIK
jgi:hypothetical protein